MALTGGQVRDLGLPPVMRAKETSSRYGKFVGRHGADVFELEATRPEALQGFLRDAVDSVLDVEAFNQEVDAEKEDAAVLDRLRRQAQASLRHALDGGGAPGRNSDGLLAPGTAGALPAAP